MSNVALGKRVLEDSVKYPSTVTNGITTGYTGSTGFAHFPFPGTLTVDLEDHYRIKCIRFLLWDRLGRGGTEPSRRRYRYRLAVSKDNSRWHELYSTPEAGTIGWQLFVFKSVIRIKYVRIYGLHNTANPQMHIIELEAHDDCPPKPKGYIGTDIELPGEPDESSAIATRVDSTELNKIIATLEQSPIDKDLVRSIKARFEDLVVLDQNLEAVRREIVNPVTGEIRKSNRLAVIALTITIIALTLTIIFNVVG